MPSSLAAMISEEVSSADGRLSATGKLAMRLNTGAALAETAHALADAAPGFVWRLQTAGGDATELRPFPDDYLIVNMSVWDSVENLREYTYKTAHVQFVRRRKEWFEKLDQPIYALWWVPAGQLPTVAEAKTRLDHLIQHGDSPTAFTFGKPFPPPE